MYYTITHDRGGYANNNLYVVSPPLSFGLRRVVLGRIVFGTSTGVCGVRSARLRGARGSEKRARFRAGYCAERPPLAGCHSVCRFDVGAVVLHGSDDIRGRCVALLLMMWAWLRVVLMSHQ